MKTLDAFWEAFQLPASTDLGMYSWLQASWSTPKISEVHGLAGIGDLTRENMELPRNCLWAAWGYFAANFNLRLKK